MMISSPLWGRVRVWGIHATAVETYARPDAPDPGVLPRRPGIPGPASPRPVKVEGRLLRRSPRVHFRLNPARPSMSSGNLSRILRPLSGAGRARQGGLRHRLRRPRHPVAAEGGDQGPAPPPGRRRDRPVPARGPPPGPAQASGHRDGLRRRGPGRAELHHLRPGGRHEPQGLAARPQAGLRADHRHRRRGGRRARARPRPGGDPPRRQALEHHAHRRPQAHPARLRAGHVR